MFNKNCMQNVHVVYNVLVYCFITFLLLFVNLIYLFNLMSLLKFLQLIFFQVILTEIIDGKFVRTFKDSDPVACLKDSVHLFAVEIPEPKLTCSVEQEKITLIVNCNLQHDENDSEM